MTRRPCIYANNEKQYDKLSISQLGVTYYNWNQNYAKKGEKATTNETKKIIIF